MSILLLNWIQFYSLITNTIYFICWLSFSDIKYKLNTSWIKSQLINYGNFSSANSNSKQWLSVNGYLLTIILWTALLITSLSQYSLNFSDVFMLSISSLSLFLGFTFPVFLNVLDSNRTSVPNLLFYWNWTLIHQSLQIWIQIGRSDFPFWFLVREYTVDCTHFSFCVIFARQTIYVVLVAAIFGWFIEKMMFVGFPCINNLCF